MASSEFGAVLDAALAAFNKHAAGGQGLLTRRVTRQVDVRGLKIGGGADVLVQSMTGVKTEFVDVSLAQIKMLYDAGSPLVRIAFRDRADAAALPVLKERLVADGYGDVRLALCMHFNGHMLLENFPECVEAADKFRINPGNVGFLDKWDDHCARIVRAVNKFPGKAIRIGVNWGSLDQSLQTRIMDIMKGRPVEEVEVIALVVSAITSAKFVEQCGFDPNQIVVSCKVSDPALTVLVNSCLAEICDYPLHLGVTEAGEGDAGIVNTVCGLAPLLRMGIGDTIRASLTDHVGSPRSREVEICKLTLQSLGIRRFAPSIQSCPGCGRAKGEFFKALTMDIKGFIAEKLPEWQLAFAGVENLKVSVMGCIVNGPGESKKADVGISLPGFGEGEDDAAVVYVDGERFKILKGTSDDVARECKQIIVNYVAQKYEPVTG